MISWEKDSSRFITLILRFIILTFQVSVFVTQGEKMIEPCQCRVS